MIEINGGVKNITGAMFRLVHDEAKVITIIEGTEKTITTTRQEVEEFTTEKEALDRVSKLGLKIEDEIDE